MLGFWYAGRGGCDMRLQEFALLVLLIICILNPLALTGDAYVYILNNEGHVM